MFHKYIHETMTSIPLFVPLHINAQYSQGVILLLLLAWMLIIAWQGKRTKWLRDWKLLAPSFVTQHQRLALPALLNKLISDEFMHPQFTAIANFDYRSELSVLWTRECNYFLEYNYYDVRLTAKQFQTADL